MMKPYSIVIAGVGGQGTLLASRIIGGAAIKGGLDVKVSEVHGMAQRGGSVTTFVRFGEAVRSPVIEPGGADIVLAFEILEAYRSLPYMKAGGRMVVNTQAIEPMPVITGAMAFPEDILGKIRALGIQADAVAAGALAAMAGTPRAANVVLIGRLAAGLDFPEALWREVITETVKPAFLETNLKAFEMGYKQG
jgi:indolepyruvate ferredoxin oxidoreductase beta subunit